MELDPERIHLMRDEEGLKVVIDGVTRRVERVAKAFPRSMPDRYVGLLDANGHEIGLIEDPTRLDEASRELLEAELEAAYFVPTITCILSVELKGTGSVWEVETDAGSRTLRIQSRDAVDGSEAPALTITDEDGKRHRVEDYWALDPDSRHTIRDLLPERVLRLRTRKRTDRKGRG